VSLYDDDTTLSTISSEHTIQGTKYRSKIQQYIYLQLIDLHTLEHHISCLLHAVIKN